MKKTFSSLLMMLMILALCLPVQNARPLNVFIGGARAETAAGEEIPADTSVFAYPVSASRTIAVENEDARKVLFYGNDVPEPCRVYVIPDDTVRLRMEIRADDDPDAMAFGCGIRHSLDAATVSEMYDPETGAFVCDRPMPSPSDENHIALCLLYNRDLGLQDPDIVELFLISGEAYIGEFVTMLEETGLKNIRWEFADDVPEEDSLQAYILRVLDQYGEPVPGVYVNFCTDTSCTLTQSDGTGTITFEGEPAAYHVQLLKVPGGYSTASGSDFYTRPAYGEWVLRVKKD